MLGVPRKIKEIVDAAIPNAGRQTSPETVLQSFKRQVPAYFQAQSARQIASDLWLQGLESLGSYKKLEQDLLVSVGNIWQGCQAGQVFPVISCNRVN